MNMSSNSDQHYKKVLSKVFDGISDNLLLKILHEGKVLHCDAGDTLFRQGDYNKTMYIVLSGRFRIVSEIGNVSHKLGDVAEAEPLGEITFFTNDPRMGTAFALRPSVVLELNEKDYFHLTTLFPEFATKLTSILIKRLQSNHFQNHLQAPPKNIVLINLQPENDISSWTNSIRTELESTFVPFMVHQQNDNTNINYDDTFVSIENFDGLNFMICSERNPLWTSKCILYADLIIIATDFYAKCELQKIEIDHLLYKNNILNKKIYLLLLHPENAIQPKGTHKWLENRKVDLHIHVRKNNARDVSRFCRIIRNQAVGLVLGGGGAKGFAHIGAVKAILNSGIPIDIIGGTSAGALYGLPIAFCDFDYHKIEYHTEQAATKKLISNDLTIPFISLLSGKKLSNYLKQFFGDVCLEDFWVSAYSVSSNFSTSSVSVNKIGLAWQKILASIAIPGVLPPVIIDKELHVDGGVVDNLPIQSMYSYPVGHILAIALSGPSDRLTDINEIPSATTLLWDKLLKQKKYKLPGMASIIINSLTLNSTNRQKQNKSDASLYIELDLKGVSFLDDSKWKTIVKKGYDQMSDFLKNLNPEEKFWISNICNSENHKS
jgi:predicted acylesterase/phospholipase RssA/CRP-like cAMP-binding protein